MAGSTQNVSKPMTVKEITAKAHDFDFNPFIALKYWLRTADTLLREAQIYEQEENDQQAYLLLMRYATLVSEKLPLHPSARSPETKKTMVAAVKNLPVVLEQMEALKPRIEARYNTWQKTMDRRKESNSTIEKEWAGLRPSRTDLAAADPAVAGRASTLAAAEHGDLAVKLAHKEIRRRDARRRATRQAGISEEEEKERRTAGLWDDWESSLSRDEIPAGDDDMRKNMEASRRRLDGSHDMVPDGVRKRSFKPPIPRRSVPANNVNSEYRYPSITKPLPFQYENADLRSSFTTSPPPPSSFPPKPPKERFETYDEPPSKPDKIVSGPSDANKLSKSQNAFTFRPSAYLENGKPLRTVFLPPTLREKFLQLAASNTRNNLETCGMLCGTLISNALFISRLVIPEQESTSDTCETINESAFFDYCASEDLMVLGWIHTHPTQTCFMSSRDLHTHCGYQIMMPESIAIVCAPSKNPSWGVFRLTDPPGMHSVLNCRKTGLFHPHEEANIYTDATKPGHVLEIDVEFQVVDMRPK